MRAAVLGGGLQGCCVALELASRGLAVTIIDKNDTLLTKAAVANEGKIHLGYMYAADPTFSTAKIMMAGALKFESFLERHLCQPAHSFLTSVPAIYVVHRESQHNVEEVGSYLETVHSLVREAAEGKNGVYFAKDLRAPLRTLSASEKENKFNPEVALSAISTPEVAINPTTLAAALRECIEEHPKIEVRCNCNVVGARKDADGISVLIESVDGSSEELPFDRVVNALWDGRFALNETLGYRTNRPWLHRLKYGVSFRLPPDASPPPSATFVSGPFGEVVTYGDGLIYLTWYPECLQAISTDVSPPDWATYPSDPLRSRILTGTLAALADIVPSLRDLDAANLPEATVKGGAIVAWGKTDIYDPQSELHRRFEIGVTSDGSFHSIDPGKLTMAPHFAEICAERIWPSS
jgi:glycine/D-amino acid oxidase-like deaminating enzyme